MIVEVVVTCGDPLFRCRCVKPIGHDDKIHACGEDVCGGSWEWLDDHRFVAHSMPRGIYEGAVLPPPEWIEERHGKLFVQCEPDGTPVVPFAFTVKRGGIRYFQPPSLEVNK